MFRLPFSVLSAAVIILAGSAHASVTLKLQVTTHVEPNQFIKRAPFDTTESWTVTLRDRKHSVLRLPESLRKHRIERKAPLLSVEPTIPHVVYRSEVTASVETRLTNLDRRSVVVRLLCVGQQAHGGALQDACYRPTPGIRDTRT